MLCILIIKIKFYLFIKKNLYQKFYLDMKSIESNKIITFIYLYQIVKNLILSKNNKNYDVVSFFKAKFRSEYKTL